VELVAWPGRAAACLSEAPLTPHRYTGRAAGQRRCPSGLRPRETSQGRQRHLTPRPVRETHTICGTAFRYGRERGATSGEAVLMSADDYDSWQETVYLLRSPANARSLMEAVTPDRWPPCLPRGLPSYRAPLSRRATRTGCPPSSAMRHHDAGVA
jgi:hypothetical protein